MNAAGSQPGQQAPVLALAAPGSAGLI